MTLIEALAEQGYDWEPLPNEHPSYPLLNAKLAGGLVYVSGQIGTAKRPLVTGKVGDTVGVNEAAYAAELCALNCLYAAGSVVLPDEITGVVSMTIFVNCAPGFNDTSAVANGASEFLVSVLGHAGVSARAAIGVSELPQNAAVEIIMVLSVQ